MHREAIGNGGKILRSEFLLRMVDDVLREIELSREIDSRVGLPGRGHSSI